MKMRQFARAKMAAMHFALFGPWGPIPQWLTGGSVFVVGVTPAGSQVLYSIPGPMVEPKAQIVQEIYPAAADVPMEQAPKFVVRRVKDNEIVAEYDTREEALALLNKHVKQKKAKLHVQNSLTGEPVLFSEEEFA